jgi:nitrogen fixation protein FixH
MQERASRNFWVLFILAFFAIDFTIAALAISMAAGDPSFRSVPGFSELSVHWDQRQQEQRRLEALGWQIVVDDDRSTQDCLVLQILDSDGRPHSDVSLRVSLFHYTRVAEQQKVACESKDSAYFASVTMDKPGLWSLDIEGVTADGERIWKQMTLDWKAKK